MNIKRKAILALMQSRIYAWVILHLIPYIRFSFYYTSFKGWQYQRGYKRLQPGDIVLITDKWKFTGMLIPGEFSHAALCVGKGSEFEIAEMIHTGYTRSCFFDLCKEATRVAIVRCNDWDQDYVQTKIIPKCLSFEGTAYDTQFEYGVKALYCAELIPSSDTQHRLLYDSSDIACIGRSYISPDDLYHSKNSTVMWDSKNEVRG